MRSSEHENLDEYEIGKLFALAAKGEFPRKTFIFGKKRYLSTSRLHFFSSIRIFSERPTTNIQFKCKFCNLILHACFPIFTGLSKHLLTHNEFNLNWIHYNEKSKKKANAILDNNIYDLIRYIISSNTAMLQLENEFFVKLLEPKMKIPCIRTFRYTHLPSIYRQMLDAINDKLDKALTICLITDIWTNRIMADFIGLAAIIVNESFKQELLVIGMTSMTGNHTSENIKNQIEFLVNSYKFNKLKSHGNKIITFNIRLKHKLPPKKNGSIFGDEYYTQPKKHRVYGFHK